MCEIWPHPCARESASPHAGETGNQRHPSSGALERRPGGAWLHVGLESAQAQSLDARLPATARLLLRSAAERLLAGGSPVRLARRGLVIKRVNEREKAAAAERLGEPSAREASAPSRRPALSPPSWPSSLAPSSLPFLPGPASSLDLGLDD